MRGNATWHRASRVAGWLRHAEFGASGASNNRCDIIARMDTSTAEEIARVFAPVGSALHSVMPRGVSLANDMMKLGGLSTVVYRTQYAHNIVGCTHNLLGTSNIGDWVLDPKASKKQLHLSRDLWSVRMLSSTYDGLVPTAGPNQARRGFYSNPSVISRPGQQVLVEQHGFIIVWTLDSKSGDIVLELVHTLSPWKYGQAEQIDLRMPLLPSESDLSTLRFVPSDDDDLEGLGLIDQRGRFQRGTRDGVGTPS
ncbi:hypothetical protein GCM10027414_27360 [Humibacter ginsengiterrae]